MSNDTPDTPVSGDEGSGEVRDPADTNADHAGNGSEMTHTGSGPLTGSTGAGAPVPPTTTERHGMFFAQDTGDTSGYGRLKLPAHVPEAAERPFGGYFDEIADALAAAMAERGIPESAIQQVTIANTEMTIYVSRAHLVELLQIMRDDGALHCELLSSLSGVDYGEDVAKRLHVVYELLSMMYRRRVRLEVSVDVDDATVPSAVSVYPTADWHEREVYDMFGVVFAGHPGLTRILMPDDWDGYPQRKDYPLGGIPVEYKGHEIPAPDQRRAYT